MTIRVWTKEDIPKLADLERRCFSDPWSENELGGCLGLPVYKTYLLEESGELLGYACQFIVCEDAEILNIAVAPEQRNKGFGGVLMEEMLRDAKALGAEKAFLEVRKTNLGAQRLYRRFDFEEYGVRKNYYPDGEDAILMQRRFACAK